MSAVNEDELVWTLSATTLYGDFQLAAASLALADNARPRRQNPESAQVFQSPVFNASEGNAQASTDQHASLFIRGV